MSCKDQTALITGACGGLGKVIAQAFLREGANVVACDIKRELVQDFRTHVSAAHPSRTLAVECDITQDAAVDDLFAQAEKAFGDLHIVVNCAGMMDRFDPVGEVDWTFWDRLMALNLKAPAMVSQRAVKAMMKAGVKGSIVNIGSIAALRGFMSGVAYTTSKHGLLGLTKNTAAFYGPKAGIRCNAVLPGGMQTTIFQNLGAQPNQDGLEMMSKSYPSEYAPFVETEDVANLVVYVASDAAKMMNGAILTADGGTIAH